MTARPLTLPRISRARAEIGNRLAAGLTLPFLREAQPGEIRLSLADLADTDEALSYWRCDSGIFALSAPISALGLLSDCPLLPPDDRQPMQEWYWTLYNQALAAAVSRVMGQIHPCSVPADAQERPIAGWLTVNWNGMRARSRIQASVACWQALLARPDWRAVYPALSHPRLFVLPLMLADVVLTPGMLRRLRPGDVIVPPTPYFSPAGQGAVTLADRRLHGAITPEAPYRFVIDDMEIIPMNASSEDSSEHRLIHDAAGDNVTHEQPLPPLPVALNIRCGQITCTLPELQRLACGAILTLRDVTPGEAWLCHGDVPLARGDLIDIEGKLGLQITRLFSAPDTPARQESDA